MIQDDDGPASAGLEDVPMKDELERFQQEVRDNIAGLGADEELKRLSAAWFNRSHARRYTYNFSWMGVPIIQVPQDIMAMQEIIWRVKPDLIIETGVARGGSLIFYASMMELLGNGGKVVGVEVDLRPHNRAALEDHPMWRHIEVLDGSSVDPATAAAAAQLASDASTVLVSLDSNHTEAHVLAELELYSPLVTLGSYLVVFDTVVEDMPAEFVNGRPWGPGDNPKTAVRKFLGGTDDFVVDREIDAQLQLSMAPEGYLRRIK